MALSRRPDLVASNADKKAWLHRINTDEIFGKEKNK
jgi:hypothetical protein